MQGFLFFTMVLYRQITVLFLLFMILILFFVPSQENYIFIVLKGLVIGGLCVVFASYAFPNIYSNNGLFKSNKVKKDNVEEKTFSSAIKVHYDRLIKHAEEIILAMNNDYSDGIYIYDTANKGFSLQNNSMDSFKALIKEENKVVIEILSTNKSQIFRIKDKLNQWEEFFSHKSWKGSETIIALPVRYKEQEIGFILVFSDHFSSINNPSKSCSLRI